MENKSTTEYELVKTLLTQNLGNKMRLFYQKNNKAVGQYISKFNQTTLDEYPYEESLEFKFKLKENDSFEISVDDFYSNQGDCIGQKLAALSDFYQILKRRYGEPSIFYRKDNKLFFYWALKSKEEEKQKKIKEKLLEEENNIEDVIIIKAKDDNDELRKNTSELIGLPFELTDYLEQYIDDFVLYKTPRQNQIRENKKSNAVLIKNKHRFNRHKSKK